MSVARSTGSVQIGGMYMFVYDPKHKERLPYYDVFPLVLPFAQTKGGFKGLNLHYVPPLARVRILEDLIDITSVRKITPQTRLKLSWDLLSGSALHPLIAPCVKEYIYSHVQSSFMRISPPEWKIAALLPIENFQNKTRLGVFQSSRHISRKRTR
jgi:hypothetical protein